MSSYVVNVSTADIDSDSGPEAAPPLSRQDRHNQGVWSTRTAQRDLDYNQDYTDPGERSALAFVTPEVRGRPILDIGVGRGRTIPLLKPLTTDYRAIDYMPQMVAVSRNRFPSTNITLDDARVLTSAPSAHFGLVQFSYNGIDAVSAEDRPRVLTAVRRALVPGGMFLFSTLNLHGPALRKRPWHLTLPQGVGPLRFGVRFARSLVWTPVHVANWLTLKPHERAGQGYVVAPLDAHHWGIVAHYTTIERQLDELERAGFSRDAVVFDSGRGHRVQLGDDMSAFDWFHIIARRL